MKIAILSTKRTLYSTRRLAESGRKRGHDMRIINPLQCILSASSEGLLLQSDGLPLNDFDCVIPRIGASMTQHGIALLAHFELTRTFVLNSSTAIALSRDKLRTLQYLAASNVPVPATVAVHSSETIDAALQRVGSPVIIKLLSGTQGIGVIKAESIDQARSTVETLWSLGEDCLIQRYIAESRGHDVRVFVVAGKVVAAMNRQASEGEFRSNLHRGGTSSPANLSARESEVALRATEILGLSVAGVDMLITPDGPLVIEVNSSPGLEGIETTTGRDVAREIITCVEAEVGTRKLT
ncbi:MAG: RimK family alpha-L-glutamate ligase [Bradymonadaceae bacterium]|nr:RimK family alpha-L-glutamate ligase [Lujinxingiaceae bacterium]